MSNSDTDYIIEQLQIIRRETHENNIMLKSIIRYLTMEAANADNENINDFGRNVFANLISGMIDINRFNKR